VELLSQTLRKEFINLYSQPILENLIKDINTRYNLNIKIDIPYIDEDFNLEEINDSIYFFAWFFSYPLMKKKFKESVWDVYVNGGKMLLETKVELVGVINN